MTTSNLFEDILTTILKHSQDLFAYLGTNCEYQLVSDSYASFFGMQVHEFVGRHPSDVFSPETFKSVIEPNILACIQNKKLVTYNDWFAPVGSNLQHYLYVSYLPHLDSATKELKGVIVIARDVSELKRAEQLLSQTANTDPLTNVFNRLYLEQSLKNMTQGKNRRDDRFGLLFCDLDGFKEVNDNYGHAIGDVVLSKVARNLKALLRQGDVLSRYGGDEFVILISNLSDKETLNNKVAEIKTSICQPMNIQGRKIQIGISIGVAIYPDDATAPKALLAMADGNMYENKGLKKALPPQSGSSSLD